jgi:hypothetical protein
MAYVDGGDVMHHAVARGRVLYFGNPKRGSSLLEQRSSEEVNPADVRTRHASRTPTSDTVGHRFAVLEGEAKATKVGSRADPTTLENERGKHLEDPPRHSAGQGQEGRVEKANDPQPCLVPVSWFLVNKIPVDPDPTTLKASPTPWRADPMDV